MKENFDDCLKRILISEGGYSNDPADPGGPTNYGITIHDYRAYINAHGTAHDVRHMSLEQAKGIYRSKYWDAVDGDNLPPGVDYTVCDYGVNSGVSRALKVYRKCRRANTIDTINAINDERMRFLHSLRTWPHFGRGWQARVNSVRLHSLQLAKEQPWPITPTKSLPQPQPSSPTTSSRPSIFKTCRTLWRKMLCTVTSKGNAQTPSQPQQK